MTKFKVTNGYTLMGCVETVKEAGKLIKEEIEKLRERYPDITHLETIIGDKCAVEIYQYNTIYKEVFVIERSEI